MPEKILIVEDEETLRESLCRVLRRDGYDVDGVASSESALASITDMSYDLVITDIILPGMNGLDLLKQCRQINPSLLVVIITAFASIESAVAAMKAGAFEFMVKPIMHDEIREVIRRALRTRSPEASPS